MPRNVEIKAKAADFMRQSDIARKLSGGGPETIAQDDLFFNVTEGRLKLRIFTPDRGELIFYTRPDKEGPKVSDYHIVKTDDPDGMKEVLARAYGVCTRVIKSRDLYLTGRTRIHFDRVEGLGDFIELEVVLSDSETLETGEAEARDLMEKLGIAPEDLIEGAYADMMK